MTSYDFYWLATKLCGSFTLTRHSTWFGPWNLTGLPWCHQKNQSPRTIFFHRRTRKILNIYIQEGGIGNIFFFSGLVHFYHRKYLKWTYQDCEILNNQNTKLWKLWHLCKQCGLFLNATFLCPVTLCRSSGWSSAWCSAVPLKGLGTMCKNPWNAVHL